MKFGQTSNAAAVLIFDLRTPSGVDAGKLRLVLVLANEMVLVREFEDFDVLLLSLDQGCDVGLLQVASVVADFGGFGSATTKGPLWRFIAVIKQAVQLCLACLQFRGSGIRPSVFSLSATCFWSLSLALAADAGSIPVS